MVIISNEHGAQYKGRRKRRKRREWVGKVDLLYLTVGPCKYSAAGLQAERRGSRLCAGWLLRLTRPTDGYALANRRPAQAQRRRTLTYRAFAQAGFQLVVLVDHVLFRRALIGNPLNVDRAVLILRRFGYRTEVL